jgi:hypothetical protein
MGALATEQLDRQVKAALPIFDCLWKRLLVGEGAIERLADIRDDIVYVLDTDR